MINEYYIVIYTDIYKKKFNDDDVYRNDDLKAFRELVKENFLIKF